MQGMALPSHLCTAWRTRTQIFPARRIELRATLQIWLRHRLNIRYAALLGLFSLQVLCDQAGLWVADTQSPTSPPGSSCWPVRPPITFPPPCRIHQCLSHKIFMYLLSWTSQILHWNRSWWHWIVPFSVYEERRTSFLSVNNEMHFRAWKLLQNKQPYPSFSFQRHL